MYGDLLTLFTKEFGRPAEFIARAPGRVNLIGEHTDYNDGFVLPAAIDRATFIAVAKRDDAIVRLVATDLGRETQFDSRDAVPGKEEPWSNYIRGVAAGLREAGYPVIGMDALVRGEVPIGSGLSSSAALEMAAVQALSAVGSFTVPPDQAARIGQRAEHTFVGTNCGLMDQLASALGQSDHVLWIDCRSLDCQPVPVPAGTTILIADTAVQRELASSAYNERRAQCEAAANAMGVPALRDATLKMLDAAALDEVIARRARHVITENARVLDTVTALQAGHLTLVGELMNDSHVSLRDLYEVSCEELDVMAELLRSQPGCYGARLTGGGFGGCAVAIMEADAVEAAIPRVASAYREQTGLTPSLFPTRAAQGAGYDRIVTPGGNIRC